MKQSFKRLINPPKNYNNNLNEVIYHNLRLYSASNEDFFLWDYVYMV